VVADKEVVFERSLPFPVAAHRNKPSTLDLELYGATIALELLTRALPQPRPSNATEYMVQLHLCITQHRVTTAPHIEHSHS